MFGDSVRSRRDGAAPRVRPRWARRTSAAVVVAVLAVALSACTADVTAGGSGAEGPPVGESEDGSLPEGTDLSPFDTEHVAIRKLDAGLLAAVRAAAEDARHAGVELRVTSGWRSKRYQQRLFDEAVVRYGSAEEARRLVSTPEKSAHVIGKAIDIGPTDAADWLIRNGADHGLCQAYANEMWHFELLTSPGGTCPVPRADAAE